MEEFGKLVSQFGWQGATLIAMVVFLWIVFKAIFSRVDRIFLDPEMGQDGLPKGRMIRAIDEHIQTMHSIRKNADAQTMVLTRMEAELRHKEDLLKELKEAGHEIILGVDRIEDHLNTTHSKDKKKGQGQ